VTYLILQILWFLALAAALGFAIGWLARSLVLERRREVAASRSARQLDEIETQRDRLQAQLAEATAAREALEASIAEARQAAGASAESLRKLERDNTSARLKLDARERDLARLSAALETRRSETAAPLAAQPVPAPGLSEPSEVAAADSPEPQQLPPEHEKPRGKARVSGSFARQK
jgi:septal ring factor EnvC (AmiA/AmiB activator)